MVPALLRSTTLRDHLQRERHPAPRRFDTSSRARPPASASFRPQRHAETGGQPSVRKTTVWSAGRSDLDERPSRRNFRGGPRPRFTIEIFHREIGRSGVVRAQNLGGRAAAGRNCVDSPSQREPPLSSKGNIFLFGPPEQENAFSAPLARRTPDLPISL
jgi:hypothetical protein